jgi:hypothetical protein
MPMPAGPYVAKNSPAPTVERTGQAWNEHRGCDENILSASWHALEQAVTYCLLRSGREPLGA